jgi:hypothetical protein
MICEQIEKHPDRFFFSTNFHTSYEPFCLDFGPVNLAVVHEFVVQVKLLWNREDLQGTELVYCLVSLFSMSKCLKALSKFPALTHHSHAGG